MDKQEGKVEVAIEELKDSAPTPGGDAVVLETEAVVDGDRHDTTIEVAHEDVPAVAVALLNSEDGVAKPGDPLPPAVKCLGAGVVETTDPRQLRLHLQFESGQVLPIEMSPAAAMALCRGILRRAGVTPPENGAAGGTRNGGHGKAH
jgi:hypothetical protein